MTELEVIVVTVLSGVVAFTLILLLQVRKQVKLDYERSEHNHKMIEKLGQMLAIAMRNDPEGNEKVMKLFDKR
jgi:hypoxanthine-guanine phosphoribosyltransferase